MGMLQDLCNREFEAVLLYLEATQSAKLAFFKAAHYILRQCNNIPAAFAVESTHCSFVHTGAYNCASMLDVTQIEQLAQSCSISVKIIS